MAVESLQCPNCGAPLSVETGQTSMYCPYCKARLRINLGASGHPLATLDEIKVDSSIIARDVVRQRLKEQLAALEAERGQVISRKEAEKRKKAPGPGPTIFGTVLAFLFALLLLGVGLSNGVSGLDELVAVFLVVGLVGLASWASQHNAINRIDEETRLELSPVDGRIGKIKAQLVEIEAEMDQLAKELHG